MVLKRKKAPEDLSPTPDKDVRSETLRSFGKRNMTTYAVAVNLDRSVPDMYDGLKTVQRRVLWGAFKEAPHGFEKTARTVGAVIAKYHPHGDIGLVDAIETMVHMPTPLVRGDGNWGNMIDGAAAMRYTDLSMSAYGLTFLDSDYMTDKVTSFVPNYDDKDIEPVTLPAKLPNVLINGGEGIGVGITTKLPSFTPESVTEVLVRMLKGEKLEPSDFAKTLKYSHKWGGQFIPSKENRQNWMQMFTGSQAMVAFESEIVVDRDSKKMVISDWPQGTNLIKFVARVRAMPECQRCYNSKGSGTFTIECKPAYNYTQFDKFVVKVQKVTQQRRSFKINVTRRSAQVVDGVTSFSTDFLALSVPELLLEWLKMRLDLERRSLTFRIEKQEAGIAYSKLLIYASDKLDAIFKALRSSDAEATLIRLLKITKEQAKQILELRVRQLSKLDQDEWKQKLKAQLEHLKQLQTWLKKPRSKVLLDLEEVKVAIDKDRAFSTKKRTEKLKVI